MQWTDRIRQVKILLVTLAIIIAIASLLISHFLVRDLSKEEQRRMEVWAQALHALNEADETTDVTLISNVLEGNNTIPVIVVDDEGIIGDYRNIEDTTHLESYAKRMMQAALEGLTRPDGSRPLLIAVTQLTSTSQQQLSEELLVSRPMEEVVASYAGLAKEAGLDGVVCSPLESPAVHERLGGDFLTVTPGVRLAGDAAGDQQRVTTPAKARELSSDYIVVGRSVTAAENPAAAYERCRQEFIG